MAAPEGVTTELVSVVVPVWNGERFLAECLESLLAQDHPNTEVVVVDDGSTDGSATVAESFAGVRVLRRPHEGLGPTRNAGIAAATASIIGFCDSDDTWFPHKATTQLAHLAARPACDVVLCRMETVFEDGAEWPSWLRRDQLRGDLDGVSPTSGLFRRSVFDAVGGYQASFGPGTDFDLLVRARTAGFTVDVLEDVLHTRRIHGQNMMTKNGEGGAAPMLQSVRAHLRQRKQAP